MEIIIFDDGYALLTQENNPLDNIRISLDQINKIKNLWDWVKERN